MYDTHEDRMDAALGRMTREYAFMESCIRGLRLSLEVFKVGATEAGSFRSPPLFAQLIKEMEKAGRRLPDHLRAELDSVLADVGALHDRRVRLSHDLITEGLAGEGFFLCRWREDGGHYAGVHLTIEQVRDDAAAMHVTGRRLAVLGGKIRHDPASAWVRMDVEQGDGGT
jgi:hypothetical protein